MPRVKTSLYKGPKRKLTAAEKAIKRQNKRLENEYKSEALSISQAKARIRALKRARRAGQKAVDQEFRSADFHIDDDGVDYSGDYEDDVSSASSASRKPCYNVNNVWKRYGNTLVQWYIEAMGKGKPHMLSVNLEQDGPACSREQSAKKVTLYMMGGEF